MVNNFLKSLKSGGKKEADKNQVDSKPSASDSKKDKKHSSENWYEDRYQSMIVQRNILSLVSLISLGGIIVCAIAVQTITKLKTIEPFVIEVSETTGVATVVDKLSVKHFLANEIISRYFLVSYVKARESFDIHRYEYNYQRVVRLFSSDSVYRAFRVSLGTGEDSIVSELGEAVVRDVKIISISFLKAGKTEKGRTAQVRFVVTDKTRRGQTRARSNRVAIVNFDFVELNLQIEDRYINPLGFRVDRYVVDDENIVS